MQLYQPVNPPRSHVMRASANAGWHRQSFGLTSFIRVDVYVQGANSLPEEPCYLKQLLFVIAIVQNTRNRRVIVMDKIAATNVYSDLHCIWRRMQPI